MRALREFIYALARGLFTAGDIFYCDIHAVYKETRARTARLAAASLNILRPNNRLLRSFASRLASLFFFLSYIVCIWARKLERVD